MRVRSPSGRAATLLATLAVALVSPSCRNAEGRPVFPVRGQVLLDGTPVSGAVVIFHPVAGADPEEPRPYGESDGEGRFTLNYGLREGAPAGEYRVSVTAGSAEGEGEDGQAEDETVKRARPRRLPTAYRKPDTSGLGARVHEGDNDLAPFQLRR